MKNIILNGDTVSLSAPVGGVVSGGVYKIGSFLVVSLIDAAEGDVFAARISGITSLAKKSGVAFTEGQLLYWDDTNKWLDSDSGIGIFAGNSVENAGLLATTCKIRLSGFDVPASEGGGEPPTGDANSMAYFDAAGDLSDNANLIVRQIDQFGRPEIRDARANTGLGAVFAQGGWISDGNPANQAGEGAVFYGPSARGIGPIQGEGGYARIKPDRFGLGQIVPGVNSGNLFYYFRVDPTSLYLKDDANSKTMEHARSSGETWFRVLRIASASGPRILTGTVNPNGAVTGSVGDLYLNTNGSSESTLWVKESGNGTNTGWDYK